MFGSALRSRLLRPDSQHREPAARRAAFFHRPMQDWERRLHMGLRVTWPCESSLEFQSLWPSVSARVRSVNPQGAAGLDADELCPGLPRAAWCLVRHLKPRTVVEAGVGYGLASRFILEALALNGSGQLYSIDPPDGALPRKVVAAIEPRVADRWSLISDTTKRAMPALLSRLGAVDLFVHNSGEGGPGMRFEVDYAWIGLKPGGILILNNIDTTGSLQYFSQRYPGHGTLVCEAEPAHLDPSRQSGGLFAIAFKNPKLL
jgi:hypothetical protein